MDFSGGEISMHVYAPREYTLELSYKHPLYGEIPMVFELDDIENTKISLAESEAERHQLMQEFAKSRSEEIRETILSEIELSKLNDLDRSVE